MTLIRRIAGCREYEIWSGKWGHFDMSKPYDVLRWRAVNRLDRLRDMPRRWAWYLADVLSYLAVWLRGHRRHEGWYGINCNEAEILRQNIDEHLIPTGDPDNPPPLTICADDAEAMRTNLDRLAALARATFWHDL